MARMQKNTVDRIITITYWVCLVIASAALLMAEYIFPWRGILKLSDTHFIAKFLDLIKENYINLYISQISTTFLVTAFLSFLSDKDDPVYWTTAMDHKLIYPKGVSLRDITFYSLFTLVLSLVAILIQASGSLLVFFVFNILLLATITCRMILTFFARDQIKDELKKDFAKMTEAEQKGHLLTMQENMIRAAHNHDVSYMRECVEFLDSIASDKERTSRENAQALSNAVKAGRSAVKQNDLAQYQKALKPIFPLLAKIDAEFNNTLFDQAKAALKLSKCTPEAMKQASSLIETIDNHIYPFCLQEHHKINESFTLMYIYQYIHIIPVQFAQLRLNVIRSICKIIGLSQLAAEDSKERETARQKRLKQILSSVRSPAFPRIPEMREEIMRLLQANMQEGGLQEHIRQWVLDTLVALTLEDVGCCLRDDVKDRLEECPFTKEAPFDLSRYFVGFVYLVKQAYDSHNRLDPYLQAIKTLYDTVIFGLEQLKTLGCKDKTTNAQEKMICFDPAGAETLFNCICGDHAMLDGDYYGSFVLEYAAKYTTGLTADNIDALYKIASGAKHLDPDCTIGYIKDLLKPRNVQEN